MMKLCLVLALVLLLSACQPVEPVSQPTLTVTSPEPSMTPTSQPTATPTPQPTDIPATPTETPQVFEVCSPLEDETFESLLLIISHPLDIPSFGQDTGHHGVDLAYYRRADRESIEGVEIYAILSGESVLTLDDVIPYGYTLLVETPLSDLPEALQETLLAGYLPVPDDPNYRLYCPAVVTPEITGAFSVYHLYAHMEEKPNFNPGDPVACGQTLGTVGNTGQSSNPHLHLETRLGPSGASIRNMAHYRTYTLEEISNYCLWRMSGHYQLFEPFILFDAAD